MDYDACVLFAKKINEKCGVENTNIIYSLLVTLGETTDYAKGFHFNSLNKLPLVIDSSIEIFTNKTTRAPRTSHSYKKIDNEKDALFALFTKSNKLFDEDMKIGDEKIDAALAVVSSLYFNNFITPKQFFLPHTSVFSGHWEFWDKLHYSEFVEKLDKSASKRYLREKLEQSPIWSSDIDQEAFPEIVKRRLIKEKAFDKELDPQAMIKAMIIRMGELANPSIKYEIIDFSIRSFFTYLRAKRYLRIDREIMFLRKFEEEIKNILGNIS
jgi:hypothetical protein